MMKFAEKNARGGESHLMHLDDWEDFDRFANDPLGARPIVYKAPGSKNVGEKATHRTFFDNEYGSVISFIDQFACPQTIEEAIYLTKSGSLRARWLIIASRPGALKARIYEPRDSSRPSAS
jgi:protein CsiD